MNATKHFFSGIEVIIEREEEEMPKMLMVSLSIYHHTTS